MSRIAVIGSGISGLGAAYYLSRAHEVFLFEKDKRIGGHTHTVTVESSRGPIPVDTGFIVHNDRTYPNLVRLFSEMGVAVQPSDMSFAVTDPRSGFEYSSRGLSGFFAQRSNFFRPAHYSLLREILRFNREAPRLLAASADERLTLGDFLDSGGYKPEFQERYLLPMASSVWSSSAGAIRSFPAQTLVRFFENHGMLTVSGHPQWKVLRGGSQAYLKPISAPFQDRIATGVDILSVTRSNSGVTLKFADREPMAFDHVVFACHGDEVQPMLGDATEREREILGAFRTSANDTCLHTDSSLLPQRPAARASWNYNLGTGPQSSATVTYHMNRLQSLDVPEDYCVTLNGLERINPSKILLRLIYHHPLYTAEAIKAQGRWSEISGVNRIHYCGAYWYYGFHEDGLKSALRVARALGIRC